VCVFFSSRVWVHSDVVKCLESVSRTCRIRCVPCPKPRLGASPPRTVIKVRSPEKCPASPTRACGGRCLLRHAYRWKNLIRATSIFRHDVFDNSRISSRVLILQMSPPEEIEEIIAPSRTRRKVDRISGPMCACVRMFGCFPNSTDYVTQR